MGGSRLAVNESRAMGADAKSSVWRVVRIENCLLRGPVAQELDYLDYGLDQLDQLGYELRRDGPAGLRALLRGGDGDCVITRSYETTNARLRDVAGDGLTCLTPSHSSAAHGLLLPRGAEDP